MVTPSAVIAIHTKRVKARDLERLFAPHYGPELIEIIDATSDETQFLPFTDKSKEAHDKLNMLWSLWPEARVCVIIASALVAEPPLRVIPVAEFAMARREHLWSQRVLNKKSIEKVAQGKAIPYPVSNRETQGELLKFVQYMVQPLSKIHHYVPLPAPR
ncbi:MAG: hypothetical protein AAB449_01055 [Patescibacteria group bacterium]